LVGFAESLPTPEVCFSLRKECARIVFFARLKTPEKFAQLSLSITFTSTLRKDNLNHAIENVTAPVCIAGQLQTSINRDFSLGLIFLALAEHVRYLRNVRDGIG
jgi:hypothetical protein